MRLVFFATLFSNSLPIVRKPDMLLIEENTMLITSKPKAKTHLECPNC